MERESPARGGWRGRIEPKKEGEYKRGVPGERLGEHEEIDNDG